MIEIPAALKQLAAELTPYNDGYVQAGVRQDLVLVRDWLNQVLEENKDG